MKKILKKLAIIGLVIGCATAFMASTGFGYSIPEEYKPDNAPFAIDFGSNETDTPEAPLIFILQVISGTLLYIAAPLAVIAIAMSAFGMVSSTGEAEKIEGSKKQLKWAILGLLLTIFSYAIVKGIITIAFESFEQKENTSTEEKSAQPASVTSLIKIEDYIV